MNELDDLRGQTFFWTVRRERPFKCVLYRGSSIVGMVDEVGARRMLIANVAGILWKVTSAGHFLSRSDEYGFADSALTVAVGISFPSGYVLDIEEGCRYSMERIAQGAQWRDAAGRVPIIFSESRWSRGSAGEARVDGTAELVHVPVLLLAGVLRAVRGRMFLTESGPAYV